MSLLNEAFEDFVVMDKVTVKDTYGGTKPVWVEGVQISGAIVINNSASAQIAQSMGAIGAYTLTVRKNVLLDFHDVLKRVRDGKIFRLVNNSDELATPKSAALNMRLYSAEEYQLP